MNNAVLCPDCHQWMPRPEPSSVTTVRYICGPCWDARLARMLERGKPQDTKEVPV